MPYSCAKVAGRIAQNRLEEVHYYEQIRNGKVIKVDRHWSTYTKPENSNARSRHESKPFQSKNPLGKKRRRHVKCPLTRRKNQQD